MLCLDVTKAYGSSVTQEPVPRCGMGSVFGWGPCNIFEAPTYVKTSHSSTPGLFDTGAAGARASPYRF